MYGKRYSIDFEFQIRDQILSALDRKLLGLACEICIIGLVQRGWSKSTNHEEVRLRHTGLDMRD